MIKSNNDFNNWKSTINNQISNNAGGGEVWLSRLNDVQQSTAKVDGQFLKYDASQKKWVGGSVDISSIVGGAPEALDTLNELAEALNDDENFATTITSSIAAKASQTDLDTHTADTTNPHSVTATHIGLGNVEDKSSADIRGEIVDGDIPSTIARDSELPTKSSLGLSNVTDESKATMFTSPSFTGTISSSGLLDFGHRTSNNIIIRAESDSHDITLIRAASNSDAVGVSLKYIGSGNGDENLFEIVTDGGGSLKIDNSGDVGINTAPIDGKDLTADEVIINTSLGIGKTPTAGIELDVSGDISASGTITGNTVIASNMLQTTGDCEIDGCELGINGGTVSIAGPAEFNDQVEFQDSVELSGGDLEFTAGGGQALIMGGGVISGAGNIDCESVTAKGYSLNANTFTVVSTTSTLAASTNGLTVILQNTGPITITLPTLAAGHVTTFISETNNAVTFVGDTGITVNSFGGNNTTAGIFAQCQVIYKTTTAAFLGGNLV